MPGPAHGTVIVVEDDPSMCQALDRILRLGGYRPVVYGSAEALLDHADPSQAQCLILDLQLPGMDGFALRERIAASRALPPVIFITAFDEPDARVRAAAIEADFLAKPFAGRVLLDTVRRALARHADHASP